MDSIAGIRDRGIFVSETYKTVQGEGLNFGIPVYLVRLQGCNLDCNFCDAESAKKPDTGKYLSVGKVVDRIESSGIKNVLITGGEPFMQPSALLALLYAIQSRFPSHKVFIESNGTIDTPILPCFIPFCISSCYLTISPKINNWPLPQYIRLASEVRCPVCSGDEIKEYDDFLNRVGYEGKRLLSPVFYEDRPSSLVMDDCIEWMTRNPSGDYRLSVQTHKFLGLC